MSLSEHRIMNARYGQVACQCTPDWMTLDEYGDHIEAVASIAEHRRRRVERLVERSSFGAEEVATARATVSDDAAAKVVARARELALEASARAEVKAAVEAWFSNVSLDDLFDAHGWADA